MPLLRGSVCRGTGARKGRLHIGNRFPNLWWNTGEICWQQPVPNYPGGRVCRIGKRAFSGTSIVSVTIPQSVIEIQQYAFADCTELASVTIPASVQSIQNRAFFHCWKLNDVSLSGNPELGEGVFSGTGFRMSQMRSAYNAIEEELDSRLMRARLENGRCPYCGSKYFGILNRVCSRCKRRRPSDVE